MIKKMLDYDKRKSFIINNINITENDQYFYLKRHAEENVSCLYHHVNINSEEILVYDPKDFKPETGNSYVINYIKPSWDGNYVVAALTFGGSEISEMIMRSLILVKSEGFVQKAIGREEVAEREQESV